MIEKHNRHWIEGHLYEFPKHREVFEKIRKFIEKKQIIALIGLRRVGKTVLLWQLINFLIKKGVPRKRILYFSYDKEKLSIDELLEEYRKITGIDHRKEKIYVFLDKIQKLENWQEQVKFYYDLYQVKFFVSGSASLFLKKATESLAGRIIEFEIPIISFKEFLFFKGKEIKETKIGKEEIKALFSEYLRKNFIEVINEEESFYRIYYENIINKVIYEDIPKIFSVENPAKLKALFEIFLNSPGYHLNYDSLASDLGLSRKTVEKYVEYLRSAMLIFKVYNFSRNFITSEKKMKRVYLTAPCFCFLSEEPVIEKIMENLAILFSNSKFFYRDQRKREIDIVKKEKDKILAIEVKAKDKIKKNELKQILHFLNKFKQDEALVITWDYEAEELIEWFGMKGKVKFVPLWKWLIEPLMQTI